MNSQLFENLRRLSRRSRCWMTFAKLWLVMVSALAGSSVALPQTSPEIWPQRNVKFIVPFSAGSGTDLAARVIGDVLSTRWGKPVIIDNRPGGDNLIAINAFVSANDDHVLLITSSAAFLAHPYVHEKLGYNLTQDLAPIAKISDTVLVAAVPSSSDVKTIAEFVQRAKTIPDKINIGAASGFLEFAVDAFLKERGLQSVRIPYRDVVGAVRDLAEDRIQFLLTSYAVVRPFVEAGKVRILAAGSREASPMLKGIPSILEAGFPELSAETSVALYGPKELPLQTRRRIAADVVEIVNDTKVSAQIALTGQDARPAGPEELAAVLARQEQGATAIANILGIQRKN